MRRDFTLLHDLTAGGFSSDKTIELIRGVRGIYENLARAMPEARDVDLRLMELELPLLGGRVWRSAERGQHTDREWLQLVADRIAEYRSKAADFRQRITDCRTEEDLLVIQRQFAAVAGQLAARLGIADPEPSGLEKDLVAAVDW